MNSVAGLNRSIWYPYTQMQLEQVPVHIVSGKGALLYDNTGREYIDAISSWWVNLHGHSHPYIIKKIHEQMKSLEHVLLAGFTHTPAMTLSRNLLSLLPEGQKKIFFSDNGSTAVEVALKMALQYWNNKGQNKRNILCLKNSYHGDTFGGMSVSSRSDFTRPFHRHLFPVSTLDVPRMDNLQKISERLYSLIRKNDVAAFIFEPLVQGVAGMIMYQPEYLDQLLTICKENNVLTIADEVMTGFFRLGRMFASDFLKEKPDILCLSKGLTGGFLPMGVTSTTDEIFSGFLSDDKSKTFFHGHSYTGNPIGCAAALASLELLQRDAIRKRIRSIEERHLAFCNKMKGNERVKEARTKGTILAIELRTATRTSYFNKVRDQLYRFYISRGVLLRPLGNVIYTMPPYCISDRQLDKIYNSIEESIEMFEE